MTVPTAARRVLERVESERDEAVRRATSAEPQRDELLAVAGRVSRAGRPARRRSPDYARSPRWPGRSPTAQRDGRHRAATPPGGRGAASRPPRIRGETPSSCSGCPASSSSSTATTSPSWRWPDLSLEQQRAQLLDAVDGLARRFGTEFVVVIDGADVVGAHADRRRLARVRYSPAGVTADDVIREEIAALDPRRPVAVVTNDREVRRDVIAAGANVITSDALDRPRPVADACDVCRPIPASVGASRRLYRRARDRDPRRRCGGRGAPRR